MKRTVKKVLSLMLVLAVLLTSMVVSSVSAATTTDPMQTVLLKALHLGSAEKVQFNNILVAADKNIDTAASDMNSLFPTIPVADAKAALTKYVALTDSQKIKIQAAVSVFDLNVISDVSALGFPTIVSKVNTELTGDAANNDGIRLMVQVIGYLNLMGKDSAYVTDDSADKSKIKFVVDDTDSLIIMAKDSLDALLPLMGTINAKIAGRTESSSLGKLLGYTADAINNTNIPADERTKLKAYLNTKGYYKADTSGSSTGSTGGSGSAPATTTTTNNAGSVSVAATVTDGKAKVTADQIKVADVVAAADAVIAKGGEKKLVLEFDVKGAASLELALPAELFTKVKEKGIEKIEIKAGDAQITVAPDFAGDLKDAKALTIKVDKLAITDAFKAKLSDEQKKLIGGNETIFEFNASVTTADGKEKKLTDFNKALSIKIKYDLKAGESKDKLTVLYLAADGTVENMVGKYDEAAKVAIFNTKHFSTYMIKNVVVSFNDIKANAWYKNQAESLAAKGIVAGKDGNKFDPNANVTRAEFMVMLVKAMGAYDKNATCDFTDVSKDSWYYTYVASAVKAGITSGIGNNKFGPSNKITRQEMAVMLTNALTDKTIVNADNYLTASDAKTISSYAKNAMALCVKNEFMVGSNNKLTPKATSTRAMAAAVIYKYFNSGK